MTAVGLGEYDGTSISFRMVLDDPFYLRIGRALGRAYDVTVKFLNSRSR